MSATRIDNLELVKESLSVLLSSEDHGLRDRQHEALLKLASSEDKELYQGYFNHATGAGKTFQMASLIKSFRSVDKNQKIIILEASIDKVKDMADDLTNPDAPEYIGEASDVVGMFNKDHKDVDKPIIVATYASLKNLIKKIDINQVGLVMPDEAHRGLSDARRESIKSFPNACVYGFTASPKYDEVRNLDNLLKNQIDEIAIAEGIAKGLNCSVKNILLVSDIDVDLTEVKKNRNGDYDEKEFNKAVNSSHKEEIKDKIVEFWVNFQDSDTGEKANKRMTMINCRSMKEAREQAQAFNDYFDVEIAKAYGSDMNDKERETTLADFEAGKFPIICQVDTLGEAYDNKKLSLCINYPTSSIVREAQRGGRPLRIDPENKHKKAWVVDIVFRHPEFKDAPVTVAAEKNKQVLYAHIAGGLDLTSPDRKIFEDITRNKIETMGKTIIPMDLSAFSIISDTEELLNIDKEHVQWMKDNVVPNKTKFMRTADYLSDIYMGNHEKMVSKLNENFNKTVEIEGEDIPVVVEAMHKNSKRLYLNGIGDKNIDKAILDEFTKLSGLKIKASVSHKSEFMKNATDISKLYVEDYVKVLNKLKENLGSVVVVNGDKFPIVMLAKSTTVETVYLNGIGDKNIDKTILDEFTKLSGLTRKDSLVNKTEFMKNAKDLRKIYSGDAGKITAKLKENLSAVVKIEEKEFPVVVDTINGRYRSVCLNAVGDEKIDEAIMNEFTKLSGLTKKNSSVNKTEFMKNSHDILKLCMGSSNKVTAKLKENSDAFIKVNDYKVPVVVEAVSSSGPKGIYLNGTGNKKIDEAIFNKFIKLSGLKKRKPIAKKNKFMKSADDLKKIYLANFDMISSELKENLGAVVEVDDKKLPVVIMAKSTVAETLYLNGVGDDKTDKTIMKEFTKLSGFKKRSSLVNKTEFMKSYDDILKLYIGSPKKITAKLKENSGEVVKIDDKNFPVVVQAFKKGRKIFCVNGIGDEKIDKTIFNEFIKLSGLEPRQQNNINNNHNGNDGR